MLVFSGRISYGLYLWHIPVFFMIGSNPTWCGLQLQGLRLATVFLVATLSFYLIEQPFLRLKGKFISNKGTGKKKDVVVNSVHRVQA